MKKIFYFFIFCSPFIVFSQNKFEREYRVKPSEVPKSSIDFIRSLNFKRKVKWFVEESNDGKTFEAKTYHKKHLYSIEFDNKGNLIDVEKKVKFLELEDEIQQKLEDEISKRFKKFKFKKIQIQYKGEQSDVKTVFKNVSRSIIKLQQYYEIIVKGKKERKFALYEITLDANCNFLKEMKFAPINSLNLEF